MPQPLAASDSHSNATISYQWDKESEVFIARWYGDMTDAILLDCYERYYGAPEYDPTCKELADLRCLTRNRLTTDGIKKMAMLAQRFRRSGLTAIVTPSDLSFGLGRMYNVFGPDGAKRIEVFRKLAPALEWLGISANRLKSFEIEKTG